MNIFYEPPISGDPIHKGDDGWYFYDETWADSIGPFDTETIARRELAKYCEANGI